MEFLIQIAELFLHLDDYMGQMIAMFGNGTYVILFLIVFAETGLVVAPFLPGDSLLFVAGTLAGSGHLNILVTYVTLLAAAIIGDTVNYSIGHYFGKKILESGDSKLFKKEYIDKTQHFYDKHGGKAIILGRFLPIVRTFVPFVAGVGKMHYDTFVIYNVVGGFIWVSLFTLLGYFFGGLHIVQKNFHYAVVGIIVISILPMVWEYVSYRREKSN